MRSFMQFFPDKSHYPVPMFPQAVLKKTTKLNKTKGWNLKMLVSNMNLPFQGSISMFRGCRHRNSFAHLKQNEFDMSCKDANRMYTVIMCLYIK